MSLIKRFAAIAGHTLGLAYAPMPSIIYLIVNSRCNLRCSMCDVGTGTKDTQFWQNMVSVGDLDAGLIRKLIDEVAFFKPLLAITSTEPLLYAPLTDIVAYASGAGMKTQVTTNGLLLEKRAEELLSAGLRSLWVSLDGPEAVHDVIRGLKGSFRKAVSGIEKVFSLRAGSSLEEIGINCSISPLNEGHIFELLNVLSGMPIEKLSLSHMNYITQEMADRHNHIFGHICKASQTCVGGVTPAKVNVEKLWSQIRKISSSSWPFKVNYIPHLSNREAVEDYYQHPEKVIAKNSCSIPWDQAQISANGDLIIMTRCFHLAMGNIRESSFRELWNGEKMRSFRKELNKVGMFPACTRCCGVL